MNFFNVSAASQIAKAELFFRALYLYSESGKVTRSHCLFLSFAWVMYLRQLLHSYQHNSNKIFLFAGRGMMGGGLHIFQFFIALFLVFTL